MLEESIILVARNKDYEKAFEICIEELDDPLFAEKVCESVYEIHKDDTIYFKLFQMMMKND